MKRQILSNGQKWFDLDAATPWFKNHEQALDNLWTTTKKQHVAHRKRRVEDGEAVEEKWTQLSSEEMVAMWFLKHVDESEWSPAIQKTIASLEVG
jgi:hypothetical protein